MPKKKNIDVKKLEDSQSPTVAYKEDTSEKKIREFIFRRKQEMQNYRLSLGIEDEWRNADIEYFPSELEMTGKGKKFEQDQDTGLRSRMVPVGGNTGNEWRSNNSDPMLLNKIQTAISIMIDQNPEAALTAMGKKFEARTKLAYAIWKRNWGLTNAHEILKLFVFNLFKYGWAVGRSYPKLIQYPKRVLTEYNSDDPSKNVYEEKNNIWFNDVAKQNMDPFRTWIDEMTRPYDVYSMNDCYYEIDYSLDEAEIEFGRYANFEFAKGGNSQVSYADKSSEDNKEEQKLRKDIVTVGFYENRLKDLFGIVLPAKNILMHSCPLPNDDGYLSLWQTFNVMRTATSPYGLSTWNIIKQDKQLYDKMKNMTMDQLVLSIMKMGFYTGVSNLAGDGRMVIQPGKLEHVQNGKVDWMEVPGPGEDSWKGLQYLKDRIDDNSGITPVMEGQLSGKTLGEVLHAKEAALKKLKTPLENLADAIEQDAYLTLSWCKQIYSIPEVKKFANIAEMQAYEKEEGVSRSELYVNNNAVTGEPEGLTATFMPEIALHLGKGTDGTLIESKESRYFQVGKDFETADLDWRGMFRVIPKSILAPSTELEKQRKTEMFNILVPLLQGPAEIFAKPCMQLIKINEEDPTDWMPDTWISGQPVPSLFVPGKEQAAILGMGGVPQAQDMSNAGLPTNQKTMQGAGATTPNQGAPTVIPGKSIMGRNRTPSITGAVRNETGVR
jgi:hypothetical protein